jgi:Rha family phage regulatory protein
MSQSNLVQLFTAAETDTDLVTRDLTTTSLMLAKLFDRSPSSINRTIESIIENMDDTERGLCGVAQSSYLNLQNKDQPLYELGEEMTLIVTGRLKGKKAFIAQMKLAKAFIKMRDFILNGQNNKIESLTNDIAAKRYKEVSPNCLTGIFNERNPNITGSRYDALVELGILENYELQKTIRKRRFTEFGIDYMQGDYNGIPRFKHSKHEEIINLVGDFLSIHDNQTDWTFNEGA